MPNTSVLAPDTPAQTLVFPDLVIKNIRVGPWMGSPKTPPGIPPPPPLGNLVQVTVANIGNKDAVKSTITSVILVTGDSVKKVGSLDTDKIQAKGECQTHLKGLDLHEPGILIVLADTPTKEYPLGQVNEWFGERNNVFAVPYSPSQEEQTFNNTSIK
jgi:hypothetical protein